VEHRDDNNNNVKNVRLKKSHDTDVENPVFDFDYMRVLKSARFRASRLHNTLRNLF